MSHEGQNDSRLHAGSAVSWDAMRQYRPTIEELKKRYSREMAQRKMLAKRRATNPALLNQPRIPDNSEPWLPHLPRSVEECAWISDQIGKDMETWKLAPPPAGS